MAVDPGVASLAPWVACPPCCFAALGLGDEVQSWVQRRWIGRPSLLASASPSQPLQSSISDALVPTALFVGPSRLQHEPLTDTSSIAWYYDEFVRGARQQFRVAQAQRVASLEHEIEFLRMVDFVSELAAFQQEELVREESHSGLGMASGLVTEHDTSALAEGVDGGAAVVRGVSISTEVQHQPMQGAQHDTTVSVGGTAVGAAGDGA